MSTPTFPLTGEQKNSLHALVDNPPLSPDFARTGHANPHLRVFAVHFDGTQNDRDDVPEGSQATLVSDSYEKLRDCGSPVIASHYFNGVGTRTLTNLRRMFESATGAGCEARAEAAHDALVRQAAAWREQDPQAEVHVHVVGFSRGAAIALHFMNLVDERGAYGETMPRSTSADPFAPGSVKSSAVLYDTVSTGQSNWLKLTVPSSAVSVLHLVAGGEERALFPVRDIADDPRQEICVGRNVHLHGADRQSDGTVLYHRIQEVKLDGARHSDVGGSYIGGNLREVSAYVANQFQASLGLPVVPVKPSFEAIQEARFHDSRFVRVSEDVQERQDSVRRREAVQEPTQNHRYALQTLVSRLPKELHLENGGLDPHDQPPRAPLRRLHFGNFASSDVEARLEALVGQPLKAKISLADPEEAHDPSDAFARMGLKCDMSEHFKCEITDGRLAFNGKVVHGCPPLQALHDAFERAKDCGVITPPVEIELRLHRFGQIHDARQQPGAEPRDLPLAAADPWPKVVREQLMQLNTAPRVELGDAIQVMKACSRAVGETLQKEPFGIGHVRIHPESKTFDTDHGRRHVNTFALEFTRRGSDDYLRAEQLDAVTQGRLRERLAELAGALQAVGTRLREKGFDVSAWQYQVHCPASSKPAKAADAPVNDTSAEPILAALIKSVPLRDAAKPASGNPVGTYLSMALGITRTRPENPSRRTGAHL